MDQRIKIKIADREYVMAAPDAESEELIRLAATTINRKISGYLTKFPGRNMVDILSFVALNESIGSISLQRQLGAVKDEAAMLKKDTDAYIENMKKK